MLGASSILSFISLCLVAAPCLADTQPTDPKCPTIVAALKAKQPNKEEEQLKGQDEPTQKSPETPSQKETREKEAQKKFKIWVIKAARKKFGKGVRMVAHTGLEKVVLWAKRKGQPVVILIEKPGYKNSIERESAFIRRAQATDPIGAQFLVSPAEKTTLSHAGKSRNAYIATYAGHGHLGNVMDKLGPTTDPITMLYTWKQMVLAIRALHKSGTVHLDIKPENFLVHYSKGAGFSVRLGDFGIAKDQGAEGKRIGTVGYMGTNQRNGGKVDYKDDLFALRMTLMNMVMGTTKPAERKVARVRVRPDDRVTYLTRLPEAYRRKAHPAFVRILDKLKVDKQGALDPDGIQNIQELLTVLEAEIALIENSAQAAP